jgi:hypothetical protein
MIIFWHDPDYYTFVYLILEFTKAPEKRREGQTYKTKVESFMKEMEEGFDLAGKDQRSKLEKKDPAAKEYLDDQITGERKYRMEGKDIKKSQEAEKNIKNTEYNRKRKQNLINRGKKWNQEKSDEELEQVQQLNCRIGKMICGT